jgi:predicted MFS family arabinose efflux permease
MTKKERIIIVLLASVNFTHILDFMIMMPLGNYLIPALSISPWQFSLLVASYPIAAFLSAVGMAFVIDRFERKKLLLITYAGFVTATATCGFANSFALLLVSRIVAGIFGGIIGGQVFSIISDLFTYERRGAAMGAVMTAFAVASSIGVYFSLNLVEAFRGDWHIPFLLVALTAIVALYLSYKYLPVLDKHITNWRGTKEKYKQLLATLQHKITGYTLLFSGIMMMGHFLIIPFLNPFMEFNLGYEITLVKYVYLVGGAASFASALFYGRLSDKVGKLKVFSYCVPLSCIMVIVLTNLPAVPVFAVLVFFAIWFSFATGRAVTSQTMISGVTDETNRGSFMILNSSVQQLGSGIAALVSGLIVSENSKKELLHYGWVGAISVIVLLAGLVMGNYLFKHTDEKKEAEFDFEKLPKP